jgi:hypothetical protein
VTGTTLPNNYIFPIKKGAHHLDLRLPNVADPLYVTEVREKEASIIKGWIEDYQNQII